MSGLGAYQADVERTLAGLRDARVVARIWTHDHTVWKPDPAEITNRLGWLHLPQTMRPQLADIAAFTAEVRAAGYTQSLLLGMGGSSLAPEVFSLALGGDGGLRLDVLHRSGRGSRQDAGMRPAPDAVHRVDQVGRHGGNALVLQAFL